MAEKVVHLGVFTEEEKCSIIYIEDEFKRLLLFRSSEYKKE